MKGLHNIYKELSTKKDIDYKSLFPAFFEQNEKKKVLFICPRMDAFGLRTMFIPALGLSDTPKMASMIYMAQKSNNEHLIEIRKDIEIDTDLVVQADIVVFPFCENRLRPVYALIRHINPKVRICFNIDFPVHHLKDHHFSKKSYLECEENIRENIYFADKVFIPNEKMNTWLKEFVDGKYEIEKKLIVEQYNTKISSIVFDGIDLSKLPDMFAVPPPFRVGFYCQHADVGRNKNEQELIKYCQQNSDTLEYVIYGANPFGSKKDKKISETDGLLIYEDSTLQKLGEKFNSKISPIKRIATNDYTYHFKNLYKLGLSVAVVMPKKDEFYLNSAIPFIIAELSILGIPVITDVYMNETLKEGVFHVNSLAEAKRILKELSQEEIAAKGDLAQTVFTENYMLRTDEQWIELENSFLSHFYSQ